MKLNLPLQKKLLFIILFSGAAQAVAASTTMLSNYHTDAQKICDGHRQLSIKTLENTCVGLVASKEDGLRMPRYATQTNDGTIYVTEMAGWAFAKGTIYALQIDQSKKPYVTKLTNLFPTKKLTMPNGIIADPEGRLYVGTPTGVFRFQPKDAHGNFVLDPTLEPVFTEFASSIFRKEEYSSASTYNGMATKLKNKHPLVQIAANGDFTELYVNVGAPSDDCGSGHRTTNEKGQCIQAESPLASAAVWKVNIANTPERKILDFGVFSRGLRNSMALTVHPISNLVIQGENGIDLSDEEKPLEELNILNEGAHYGWPYCHSQNLVAPVFKNSVTTQDCAKNYRAPVVFMPAHTAPLGLLYPSNTLLPELRNKLLVSWHGYQKYGHRIVAYDVDSMGRPVNSNFVEIVSGWEAQEGLRPRGAPTGLLELNDGSILILDDKNGAVLRLSRGENQVNDETSTSYRFSEDSLAKFNSLLPLLKNNCSMCHAPFQKNTAQEVLKEITGSLLLTKSPFESPLYQKVRGNMMPPESIRSALNYGPATQKDILSKLEVFLNSL